MPGDNCRQQAPAARSRRPWGIREESGPASYQEKEEKSGPVSSTTRPSLMVMTRGAAAAMERGIGFERTEKVARAALSAARAGKSLCIPSADMRLLWAASHIAPYRAVLAVERHMGII